MASCQVLVAVDGKSITAATWVAAAQNAPLPAIITEETNVTMRILVDGGLVEVYGMDAVALTAVATPSSGVSPELRTAGVFAEGAAVASACEVHGWKLSLK